MPSIRIRQLFDYNTWTYTYLIWCPTTNLCLLIDPVIEQINRDLTLINNLDLKLEYILETHVHADHITAANTIRERTNTKIVYGENSGVKGADILMKDNGFITLGNYKISGITTPGHTSGCISYYVDNYIFTGDTLFIGGTGRTDFQEGSPGDTYDSITKKIFKFSNDTIVYPAHNYNGLTSSTIGEEKKTNPNVGLHISKNRFIKNEKNKTRPYPKKFDIAVPANMLCGIIKK